MTIIGWLKLDNLVNNKNQISALQVHERKVYDSPSLKEQSVWDHFNS